MQPTSDIAAAMPIYGSNATSYREPPSATQMEDGVIPLDSLPADWWNWLWYNITIDEAKIVSNLGSIFNEIIAVLTAAGKTPSATDSTQLLESIRTLCRVVATTTTRGAVLSSTASGQLAVASDGKATINCLGNPTSLDTTDKTVVGAINELYAAVAGLSGTYAPKSHASSATTYGVGSTTAYGHVMVCAANGLSISNGVISMGNATISTTTYPGACCTGTVTSIQFNNQGTCCCKITGSGTVCLGANAWNSTAFTTCTGTVTGVKFNGTTYSGTGVVDIGSITGFPGYGSGVCSWNCTCTVGTSNCVARADHSHGLPWGDCCLIAIGCNARSCGSSVAIGWNARSCGCSVAIGWNARSCSCDGVAIGYLACSYSGIAIGCAACTSTCATVGTAIGHYSCVECARGIALGYHACTKSSSCNGVAIGDYTCTSIIEGVAIGSHARTYVCNSCVCVYASVGPIRAIQWSDNTPGCDLAQVIISEVGGNLNYLRRIPTIGTFSNYVMKTIAACTTMVDLFYFTCVTCSTPICYSLHITCAEIIPAGCILFMR